MGLPRLRPLIRTGKSVVGSYGNPHKIMSGHPDFLERAQLSIAELMG